MNDEVIYQAGNVLITRALAHFGNTTFPINGISSVTLAAPVKGGIFFGIVWLILFLIIAVAVGEAAFLILIFPIGFLIHVCRLPHAFIIKTASGDSSAMVSRNVTDLQAVKSAIEHAAVLRG